MPDKLPKGWAKTKLGEVCLPVANIKPEDSPDTEFTYFDIGGIDNERNRISETKPVTGRSAPSRARQALRKDDILFSTVRTYLRKIARVEHDYPNPVGSTGFAVIRPAEGVSSQFLLFQVLSENFLQPLHALQTGSSYPAVRVRDVFAQPILLPPTREQERIAAKLSAAFSGVERAETAARRAQERLQRYRSAVLDAALTGKLTRQWRRDDKPSEATSQMLKRVLGERRAHWEEAELERHRTAGREPKDDNWKSRYPEPTEPEIAGLPDPPNGWAWASAEQLTEATRPISYGVIKLGVPVKGGVPILRSSDVRPLRLELHEVKRIAKKIADKYHRTYLRGGEVLVTVRGTLGGVAAVPAECAGYNISREVAMLALIEPNTSPAVAYFIGADLLQEWLRRRTRGIAHTGINIQNLRALPIPVVPLSEQAQIVNEVGRRLSAAERLQTTLEQQAARARATRHSLLSEAFAGRLVPQDLNDETASRLLERIRATREAEAQKPKGRRMSKSKATMKTAGRQDLLSVLKKKNGPMTPEQLFLAAGFKPSQVDQFYRELALLRDKVREEKPKASAAKLWPLRAHVFLQLKKGAGR